MMNKLAKTRWSEASFRLKSGKLSLKPAIVFGPPETADFNGQEHFDYVESFFVSLGRVCKSSM